MNVRHFWKQQLLMILCLSVLYSVTGCGHNRDSATQSLTLLEEEGSLDNNDFSDTKDEHTDTQTEDSIYVYVCGAVNQEGVYELREDSRVYEAIACAKGLREDAMSQAVNQAERLTDGQQIYIPTKEEFDAGITSAPIASDTSGISDGKVHLNTASKEELQTLSGIGEAKAESIISYREAHGEFQSIEELMNVEGIKEGTFQKIKEQIAL